MCREFTALRDRIFNGSIMNIPSFLPKGKCMSLYIRDPEVNALADEVMRRLGTKTKTEAVRYALENVLKQGHEKRSLRDRIKKYQDEIAALGPKDPAFDEKAFMDEMWEY
jgi:antitoxin VapB